MKKVVMKKSLKLIICESDSKINPSRELTCSSKKMYEKIAKVTLKMQAIVKRNVPSHYYQ